MNVTYEHRPAMTFIGFSTSIRPEEGYGRRFGEENRKRFLRLLNDRNTDTLPKT